MIMNFLYPILLKFRVVCPPPDLDYDSSLVFYFLRKDSPLSKCYSSIHAHRYP